MLEHQLSKSKFSAPFDTPGDPGGIQVSNEKNIFDIYLCVIASVSTNQRLLDNVIEF